MKVFTKKNLLIGGVAVGLAVVINKTAHAKLLLPLADKKTLVEEGSKTAIKELDPKYTRSQRWIQRGKLFCCTAATGAALLMGPNPAYLPNLLLGSCCAVFWSAYAGLGIYQRWKGDIDPKENK